MADIELKSTPQQKAQRLLRMAASAAMPVVMASAPTFAALTSSTALTGTSVFHNTTLGQGVFQYLGTVPVATSSLVNGAGGPGAGHENWNANQAGQRRGPLMEVYWSSDTDVLEVIAVTSGNRYRLFVDELDGLGYRAASLTPAAFGTGDYLTKFMKVTFAAAKARNYRFECTGVTSYFGETLVFGGVVIPNNYSVWKTPIDTLRMIHYCDSYGSQYGDSTFNVPLAMSRQLGFKLGVADFFASTVPGDGYLVPGGVSGLTFRQRMATDIIPYTPDWVVVGPMGGNDRSQVAADLQAEVTLAYTQLAAALPNANITVISANRAPSINAGAPINSAIVNGVKAVPGYGTQLQVFDTFDEAWQSTGAGKVGATSGVGNSNIYIGADGVHPVQVGHDYLSSRIRDAVIRHASTLALAA